MQMMKKSRSNNQDKYKILCDLLCDNIDDLLSYFHISINMPVKWYRWRVQYIKETIAVH